jgi:hypothetical protein
MSAGPGPGHNGGPTLEPGTGWRRHCWQAARERLLPTLPIEVLRGRLRRAQDLGLDYRTYASLRAATGHDVVAFLFSSNALRDCGRIALAQQATPEAVIAAAAGLIDGAHPAPPLLGSFARVRADLRAALGRVPGDRVVLVGDHRLEQDWTAAGRLAFYLPAERYFAPL